MSRRCALVLLIGSLALHIGCQSHPNQINPYLGYGSPRIPPPGTGGYQLREPYYQQQGSAGSQQPAQTAPAAHVQGTSEVQVESDVAASGGWRSPRRSMLTEFVSQPRSLNARSSVAPAGFQDSSNSTPSRATQTSTGSSSPVLNRVHEDRMHVNDATVVPSEPQPSRPARQTSESPEASLSESVVSKDSSSLGWRAKYIPNRLSGVVVR